MGIRLIRIDASLRDTLASADGFRERYGADLGGHLEDARQVADQTLDFHRRVKADDPWGGYFVADTTSDCVIGTCGFKGNPSPDGLVEIAYGTFPTFRGLGYATAMALRLVAVARETGTAACAIAHTLPESKASMRVLEKAGFRNVGEVIDPEDGRVWQWRCPL